MHQHAALTTLSTRLWWAIGLNIVITASQFVGAAMAASLALFSDALHNFSDVAGLIVSLIAVKLAAKAATTSKSFGYRRAEILAALFNGGSVLAVSVYLVYESSSRLIAGETPEVGANTVVLLAAIALAANGFSTWLLMHGSKDNMNQRGAYLHLLSDTLFSAAVLAGGLAMRYLGWYWLDPLLSLVIGLYLIYGSYKLVAQAVRIVMQFTPAELNLPQLAEEICKIEGVKNIHHVHVWQLTDNQTHLEAHIGFEQDLRLSECQQILRKVSYQLKHHHSIQHIVLQPEFNTACDDSLIVQDELPKVEPGHHHGHSH